MKRFTFSLLPALLVLVFAHNVSYAQLYSGPATGSVPSGVMMSTNTFPDRPVFEGNPLSPYVKEPKNELEEDLTTYPDYLNKIAPTAPEGSNKVKVLEKDNIETAPIVFHSYQGFNDPGNYIPPDQHVAVGPNHVVGVDNGRFRIWDKSGNLLKTISADAWFATTLAQASCFDPKVEYDQFNKRWIMVWLDENNTAPRGYYLISVSADSNAIGTWYNWATKSTLNGNVESGQWSDYEGVGFDSQALYITGRMFGFSGGFYGCRLRIIDKANLYSNTAGQLTWTDMWSIKDPGNSSISPDGIRPTIIYGSSSQYYLMVHGPFSGSNSYVILYKITNPISNPVMTGVDIPVTAYSSAPNAQQLGGGALLIEAGGSNLRNEPTYRNGFLYFVHSINSGTGYSNVRYLKINPTTNAAVEDVSFGTDPYFHFYPAIAVDQDQNMVITYSRSSPNEYIGAYYTYKLASDPPGLAPERSMQNGKANYQKDFGGGRNRWGDYMGAWLDPADQNNFWLLTEYAESPANTWGVWMTNLRLVTYGAPHIYTANDTVFFGNKEVNAGNTDTVKIKIFNYGNSTLTISNIQSSSSNFIPVGNPSTPFNLNSLDSISLKVLCVPTVTGNINDTLKISSNDPTTPLRRIKMKAYGYVITPVTNGVMYGVAGTLENGALVTINTSTGTGTAVGPTGYTALTGLAIKKTSGQLYGTFAGSSGTPLVRINAAGGDAYQTAVIPVANVRAIAWDMSDQLYFAPIDGRLFRFNPATGDTVLVGSTGISNLYGLSVSPVSGNMWGISLNGSLYRINKSNASSTLVGTVGSGLWTSIAFDISGKLYVIKGLGTAVSDLYTADTNTAAGTLIGTTGKKGISGIGLSPNPIGIIPISNQVPDRFELYQNYPNPFNPSTLIKFDVAEKSIVRIRIYDVTGKLVSTLVDQNMNPGRYSVDWQAVNYPSGVYFYHIEAGKFSSSKKMILLK